MTDRVIKLTKGFVAVISSEDFRRVNKYNWHVHMSRGTKRKPGQPYARANIKGKKVYLHRFVMDAPALYHVDHINFQTLDCRRSNLSITSPQVNILRKRNLIKAKK